MGRQPYKMLETFSNLKVNQNNIVLEIGSERGEGSSLFLYNWATKNNIDFFSIDVLDSAKKEFVNFNANFIVASAGHIWCKDELPKLRKLIKILYLDNFDWTDVNNLKYDWLHELINSYKERGVIMNNQNSQEEHRLQALYCIPFMDEQSIVFFDDTWKSHITPSGYDGKSGTAIPLFIEAGYKINEDSVYGLYAHRKVFCE